MIQSKPTQANDQHYDSINQKGDTLDQSKSKNFLNRSKKWVIRYRDELTFGTIFFALSTVAAVVISEANLFWVIVTLNVAMVLLLIFQRASVSAAVARFRDLVIFELGLPWYETLYSRRETHTTKEKHFLAQLVAQDVLGWLLDRAGKEHANPTVRIILDSGTTLTPIFKELIDYGIQANISRDRVKIATNNLAGIAEIQKYDILPGSRLDEGDFILLGGTPLGTYRATTGNVTQQALSHILSLEPKPISIGILTANWLLIGQAHDTLVLCARGRGHAEFKQLVADRADYLLIVSPLGKLLCVDDVSDVNHLISTHPRASANSRPPYKAVTLNPAKRDKTFLITTQRPRDSNSPLRVLSSQVFELPPSQRKNFTIPDFTEFRNTFVPPGSRDEVRKLELPHIWTRLHTRKLFDEA